MKATVLSSTLRRDDKYLVVVKAGKDTLHVVSETKPRDGQDVTVRDGRIVA